MENLDGVLSVLNNFTDAKPTREKKRVFKARAGAEGSATTGQGRCAQTRYHEIEKVRGECLRSNNIIEFKAKNIKNK